MDGLILGTEGFWKGQIYSYLSVVNQNALTTEPSDLVLDLELLFLPMFHIENTCCVCQRLALFPMALFIGIAISKENCSTDFEIRFTTKSCDLQTKTKLFSYLIGWN